MAAEAGDSVDPFAATRARLKPTTTVVRQLTDIGSAIVSNAVTRTAAAPRGERRVLCLLRNFCAVHEWLHPSVQLWLLTDPAVEAKLPPAARARFAEIVVVANFVRSGLVELDACAMHARVPGGFTHVLALVEEDLLRAARLREAWGLVGPEHQSIESALAFRDKLIMKGLAARAGLAVPTHAPVADALDVARFVAAHGFPVVLKPRRGVSSINTHVLRSDADVRALATGALGAASFGVTDVEVESFVRGAMYHVDGLVVGGVPVLVWPSRYLTACIDFAANGFLASVSLDPNDPVRVRLQEFVVALLAALPGPRGFSFHAEVWVDPDSGALTLCEIASRTGGAGVRVVTQELFGVDLNRSAAQVLCDTPLTAEALVGDGAAGSGNAPAPWHERLPLDAALNCGWLLVYPQTGRLCAIPRECAERGVHLYLPYAAAGDTFAGREHCVDAVAQFIIKGRGCAELEDNVRACFDWFARSCVWEP